MIFKESKSTPSVARDGCAMFNVHAAPCVQVSCFYVCTSVMCESCRQLLFVAYWDRCKGLLHRRRSMFLPQNNKSFVLTCVHFDPARLRHRSQRNEGAMAKVQRYENLYENMKTFGLLNSYYQVGLRI